MTQTREGSGSSQRQRHSPLSSSVSLIAIVTGVGVAFFGTPFAYDFVSVSLRDFANARYPGWATVVSFCGYWLIALALFALGRGAISGGFIAAALRFARRGF